MHSESRGTAEGLPLVKAYMRVALESKPMATIHVSAPAPVSFHKKAGAVISGGKTLPSKGYAISMGT